MSDTLEQHLLAGRFDDALAVARDLPLDELRDALMALAFQSDDLACYGFCVALLDRQPGAVAHGLASDLLAGTTLNQLPGAYRLAYWHARRAAELEPDNVGYREFLLFFHDHPERLLPDDEAREIAQWLRARDPDNDAARAVLDR